MPRYGLDQNKRPVIIWFQPSMNLSRPYVYWLLDYILLLQDGKYPSDPSPTGYTDSNIQKTGLSSKASFITAAEIYAELTRRLDACFPDCYLVYEKYWNGYSFERIGKIHRIQFDDIKMRIMRVIAYISSGAKPRWVNSDEHPGLEYQEFIKIDIMRVKYQKMNLNEK